MGISDLLTEKNIKDNGIRINRIKEETICNYHTDEEEELKEGGNVGNLYEEERKIKNRTR